MAISITDVFGVFLFAVNSEGGLTSAGILFAATMAQYIPHGGGVL